MSETEYPYEALRAFCATKPTEFDAFMRHWKEEHPAVVEPIVEKLVLEAPEPPKRRTRKTVTDDASA